MPSYKSEILKKMQKIVGLFSLSLSFTLIIVNIYKEYAQLSLAFLNICFILSTNMYALCSGMRPIYGVAMLLGIVLYLFYEMPLPIQSKCDDNIFV